MVLNKKYYGFIILILFVLFTFFVEAEAKKEKRPNILFAFADDWGKYASCYSKVKGSEAWQTVVKTPNVDRIANEGILFNNAFVNAPSCTPCRSSVLSGQYFYRTGLGAILSGAKWDFAIPTYPLILEKEGYHIGYTYKVWRPGTPPEAGYGGVRTKYQSAGDRFCKFSQNATELIKRGMDIDEAKVELYKEVRENFQSFLDAKNDGQPFCYWFGPNNTHRTWIAGSGKKLWGIEPDSLKGKLPPFLPDVDTVREDFADYLGEVMAFDAGLGIILEMLEETGDLENTLIVTSGDHGIPGFTHGKCNLYDFGTQVTLAARGPGVIKPGRVADDFVSLMDLAPTFLEAADVKIPDIMTGKSLMPVFSSNKTGQIDESRKYVITGRERHVSTAREGNLPYPQRALRNKEFLYIINFKPDRMPMGHKGILTDKNFNEYDKFINSTHLAFADYDASPTKSWIIKHRNERNYESFYEFAFGKRPEEELYNIEDDPFQVNNLAESPKYKEIKEIMNKQLMSELRRTNDPRVVGDGKTFDNPPYAGTGK